MYSPTVEKLIKLFRKFPTIGPRTAARFVFYLINAPKQDTDELIEALSELKKQTKICPQCFKSYEPKINGSNWSDRSKMNQNENAKNTVCHICSDGGRNKSIICIVEKEIDLETIEKTKQFKGLYFILGGVIVGVNGNNKAIIEQRVDKLIQRIKTNGIQEIILALNPTVEGQNTALLIKRKLEPLVGLKLTQLGRGLPIGGELEYADDETLSSAFENRK